MRDTWRLGFITARCGLRIAEALALTASDVDLQNDVLTVRHGKGDKARKLGIDETSGALLARWIDKRAGLGLNKRGRSLSCTLQGGEIDQSYVWAPAGSARSQGRSRPCAPALARAPGCAYVVTAPAGGRRCFSEGEYEKLRAMGPRLHRSAGRR